MYKLLPILLFAFILANPSNYDKEIQDWINDKMNDSYDELNLGLDRNLYLIEVEYEILDTFNVNMIITKEHSLK